MWNCKLNNLRRASLTRLFAILVTTCNAAAQTTERFEIRLSDGVLGPHEGRLEVYYEDSWGTVTGSGWGVNEANVVCKQLGFYASFPAVVGHKFGTGLRGSVLDKIKCSGSERRLDECSNLGWLGCSGDCSSDRDVGVRCIKQAMPDPLYQLRLTGISSQFQGLVEVQYNDDWGPVCGNHFTFLEAITVCRQLGYGPPKHSRIFTDNDSESRPKLIHNAVCLTWQRSLLDCGVNDNEDVVCSPSNPAAYVACNKPTDPYPLYLDSLLHQYEGAVRIYSDGQFGTICDTGWDASAAEVVCRQLGYGSALGHHGNSQYGPSPDGQPILLDSVRCAGTEALLAQCSHKKFRDTACTHQQEASVKCDQPELNDFSLRIADGNAYQGRLEVAHGGQWMVVCNDTWDMAAANVSCRQIGLGPALSASAEVEFVPQFVLWNAVSCDGSEDRLDQCRTSQVGEYSCSDRKLAGVTCSPYGAQNQNRDEIRLTGSILPHDGAVQVYKNGLWQAVCPSGWDSTDALVACRQLGYRGAVDNNAFTTEPQFYMDNVTCAGSEANLTSCPHAVLVQGEECDDARGQAGVTCNPFREARNPADSTPLRLVGGKMSREGRVEVYVDGDWGAVCGGKTWDMNAANVACRQLGYEQAEGAVAANYAPNSENVVDFLLDGVDCIGTELMLTACAHNPWGQALRCPPNETATVICKELPVVPVRPVDTGISDRVYVAIGIAIGVVAFVVVLAICATWYKKKRTAERRTREGPDHHNVQHEHLPQGQAANGAVAETKNV